MAFLWATMHLGMQKTAVDKRLPVKPYGCLTGI
jgi:hypothetical protein